MIYHFLILSGEKDDFLRELLIDSKSTFLDLHNAIQDIVNYDKSQLASFFIADLDWNKGQEVTLMAMGSEQNSEEMIMDQVKLEELIIEKHQKLIYQFDFFGNRGFFVEMLNIGEKKELAKPVMINAEGSPPEQIALDEIGLDGIPDLIGLVEDDEDENEEGRIESIGFDDLNPEEFEEYF